MNLCSVLGLARMNLFLLQVFAWLHSITTEQVLIMETKYNIALHFVVWYSGSVIVHFAIKIYVQNP